MQYIKYNNGLIRRVFGWVANLLIQIARFSGLTYNEINIICYYFLIPLSWTILFDIFVGQPYTTILLSLIWVGVIVFKRKVFREWCDWLFRRSVDFLLWFNRWGGNYTLNSVVICVLFPIIIYAVLISLLIWKYISQ